jgi:hypothetical protein
MSTITIDRLNTPFGYFENAKLNASYYVDNPKVPAWELWSDDLGPLATITVHLTHATPNPGCVWIKDWSENAGMLEELERLGIVERTGRVEKSGYVEVPEARILRAELKHG